MLKHIEVIATSLEDVRRVCDNGGTRIELISAFSEGGLTPSYGLVKEAQKITKVALQAMIRPHSSSFHYTKDDLEIMKQDIIFMKEEGVGGVVLGITTENREIDTDALDYLLPYCEGMEVTFHRAFDEVKDKRKGLEVLKQYKQITRILTSGGPGNILDNLETLRELRENSGHITILVGGGVKSGNIEEIIGKVHPSEIHIGTTVRENNSIDGLVDGLTLQNFIELCK